jgi:hypothetical protein
MQRLKEGKVNLKTLVIMWQNEVRAENPVAPGPVMLLIRDDGLVEEPDEVSGGRYEVFDLFSRNKTASAVLAAYADICRSVTDITEIEDGPYLMQVDPRLKMAGDAFIAWLQSYEGPERDPRTDISVPLTEADGFDGFIFDVWKDIQRDRVRQNTSDHTEKRARTTPSPSPSEES